MKTHPLFNNYNDPVEQQLLEDLVIESICIHGIDSWYLPRTLENKDKLFGESDITSFNESFEIPIYIKNIDGFSGDGNFLSKFGLQIKDQVTFSVARLVFTNETGMFRPNEGDLLYFPQPNKCFQILFTNKEEMFYPLGSLQTWEMTCELFEYSGERFNTGRAEVDRISAHSFDLLNWSIETANGEYLVDESNNIIVTPKYDSVTIDPMFDNDAIQTEADDILDFNPTDPFSEGNV